MPGRGGMGGPGGSPGGRGGGPMGGRPGGMRPGGMGPMGRPGGFWGMFPFFRGGFRPGCLGCLPMVVTSLGAILTIAFLVIGL